MLRAAYFTETHHRIIQKFLKENKFATLSAKVSNDKLTGSVSAPSMFREKVPATVAANFSFLSVNLTKIKLLLWLLRSVSCGSHFKSGLLQTLAYCDYFLNFVNICPVVSGGQSTQL